MRNKRAYQKFCIIVILATIGVLLCNLAIWHKFTLQIQPRTQGFHTGDLICSSYLHDHAILRKNSHDLPGKHLNFSDYTGQDIDVITIGDSLSQGQGQGPNRYYQDYIATLHNLTVLDLSAQFPNTVNTIESVAMLVNSGFFEHLNPRFLILQSIEGNTHRFGQTVDLEISQPLDTINNIINNSGAENECPPAETQKPGFANIGNFKWLWYNFFYLFSSNALISDVYLEKLDRPLFTGEKGDSLLFLERDLKKHRDKSQALNERTVRKINDNLNRLSSLLAEKNIRLIFMPTPDKYSLYRPYLVNKRHSRSAFFEHLRWQPKSYQIIDTEAILSQELKSGSKDLYWADDSHWSWKASKAVFEQFHFE